LASNPAPSDTYVQFNQNGAFGANADFAYIYTSSSLQQGSGTVALGQYSGIPILIYLVISYQEII